MNTTKNKTTFDKKENARMIRDGFKAAVVFGNTHYPVKDVNTALDTLFDDYAVLSEFPKTNAPFVVIFDNVFNVERYRYEFDKKSGRYNSVCTKN